MRPNARGEGHGVPAGAVAVDRLGEVRRQVEHEIAERRRIVRSEVIARREIGEDAVPFHKFADLVKNQVKKLTSDGHGEVAFRVAVKDGKVNFTAKVKKGEE